MGQFSIDKVSGVSRDIPETVYMAATSALEVKTILCLEITNKRHTLVSFDLHISCG